MRGRNYDSTSDYNKANPSIYSFIINLDYLK